MDACLLTKNQTISLFTREDNNKQNNSQITRFSCFRFIYKSSKKTFLVGKYNYPKLADIVAR